jgi:hypothetical protein
MEEGGGRWTVTLKLNVATAQTAQVSALLLHHAKNMTNAQ